MRCSFRPLNTLYAFCELGRLTVLPQCSRPGEHETTRNDWTAMILQAIAFHPAQRATLNCDDLTLAPFLQRTLHVLYLSCLCRI